MAIILSTTFVSANVAYYCGQKFFSDNYDNGDPSSDVCSIKYDLVTGNPIGCDGICDDWFEIIGRTRCGEDFENYSVPECGYCQEDDSVNVPYHTDTTSMVPCSLTSATFNPPPEDPYAAGCGCYFDLNFTDPVFTDAPERADGIDCDLCPPNS